MSVIGGDVVLELGVVQVPFASIAPSADALRRGLTDALQLPHRHGAQGRRVGQRDVYLGLAGGLQRISQLRRAGRQRQQHIGLWCVQLQHTEVRPPLLQKRRDGRRLGFYVIENVPTGPQTIVARTVGYSEVRHRRVITADSGRAHVDALAVDNRVGARAMFACLLKHEYAR